MKAIETPATSVAGVFYFRVLMSNLANVAPNASKSIRVHAIIGSETTGKGTVVRHLTGCRKRSNQWFVSVSGEVRVFSVRLSSLQEGQQAISPNDFIAEILALRHAITDILIPLRLKPRGSYPGYDDYLEAFRHVGWQVASVAFLGGPAHATKHPRVKIYPSVGRVVSARQDWSITPSNWLADTIRSEWGW